MMPAAKGLSKAALREGARQIETGTGIGRAVVDPRSPITTWHGSPHTFPPTANNPLGEFDPMKVGTGEGAQAYGTGAGYLAEAKGLAEGYRNALGHKGALDLEYESGKRGIPLSRESRIEFMRQAQPNVSPEKAAKSFQYANSESRNLDQAKLAELFKDYKESKQGNLYKVDLPDEHVAKMLDWDKPLSEQHPDVQSALAKLDPDSYHPTGNDYSPEEVGAETYLRMANSPLAKNQSEASEVMRNAGITGIRYLDAASRDAAGKGTSNFVVFDPKHMNILERNGVGGAMIPRPKTEFEILHDTAQRNAALPVEQGGLGLPEGNTAMERATASGYKGADESFYGGEHRPPMSEDGAPMHDLTGGGSIYPDDVYSGNAARYYGAGDPAADSRLFAKLQALRNKPEERVRMFRAVPSDVMKTKGNHINHGDWVTPSRQYAVEHGEGALNGDYRIQAGNYPAKSLFTNGDSPYEFGLDKSQYFAEGPAEIPLMIGSKHNQPERSRFAAFDPMRRHEADILAGVGVGGMLDPQAIAEALRQQDRK
jgi:hypothetical protein